MSEALRSLLAEFIVQVDKAGELARGNAQVDALKERLVELQAQFEKVKAPAERAGRAIRAALTPDDIVQNAIGAAGAGVRNSEAVRNLTGGGSSGGDGFLGAGLSSGKVAQFGPTRETLNAGRAAMRQSEQAAADYAKTLKGKLAGAVQAVRAGFNRGGGSDGPGLLSTLGTVRNGLIALGVGATARAVVHLVDGIGHIKEAAQRLGVTTGVFQRLKVLADQNGTSVESLGTAFRSLANNAVQPTKASTAAFAKLGVSVKDTHGQFKSTNELFFEVAGALADVGNETERSAIAQDLLGRSAIELKPIFAGGRSEIEKQRKALAQMNVLSDETINQADDLADSWKAIGPSFLSAAEPLLKLLLPALTRLTQGLFKGIDVLGKWLRKTDLASVALTALGFALYWKVLPGLELMVALGGGVTKSLLGMAGAGWRAVAPFLRMALALLAIEDVITFLRGGDSETGRILDKVFGKGTAEGTIKTIDDLAEALRDLWRWLSGDGQGEKVKKLYNEISDGINVMLNDLLHLLGIGKGGTNGPLSLSGETVDGSKLTGAPDAKLNNLYQFANDIPVTPTTLGPAGPYGPPAPPVTIGDRTVNITMGPSATAGDVGRAVGGELDRDNNALIAAYGGF